MSIVCAPLVHVHQHCTLLVTLHVHMYVCMYVCMYVHVLLSDHVTRVDQWLNICCYVRVHRVNMSTLPVTNFLHCLVGHVTQVDQ